MRVLVIGGNGFLGSSLVEHLRGRVHLVRVVDQRPPRHDMDWTGVEYVVGTFDDPSLLRQVLAGIDVVFHLASTTVPSTANADPIYDVSSNLLGALRLVAAMQVAKVRRIVFFSSGGTVYGHPVRLPIDEHHPLRPICSYGLVKLAIEGYLRMYQQLGVLDPLMIRPSNPYGPRQPLLGPQGVVASFLGKARDGATVTIWGDGSVVRDFIYVDDLMTLAVTAGLSDYCGELNAGSGVGHSLNEVCDVIRSVTGQPLPVTFMPGRPFDVEKVVLCIEAAQSHFGWRPLVSLENGIGRTWKALESGLAYSHSGTE